MHVLDYGIIRNRLMAVIRETGLKVSVEETVVLTSLLRECSILMFSAIDGPAVWGKITFEWAAENQVLLEEYIDPTEPDMSGEADYDLEDNQIAVHIEFHMHFSGLSVSSEVVSSVARSMKQTADEYFGNDGRVITEVYMDAEDAKIDCLRYEKHGMHAIKGDEPWWEHIGMACQGILAQMAGIYERLGNLYG